LNVLKQAADKISSKCSEKPQVLFILGSGLGFIADDFEDKIEIEYSQIPGFAKSTVRGHKGKLVVGKYCGKYVAAMQGRFHYYEGWTVKQVVFPVEVFRHLGTEYLLITNSAGGINRTFKPGDIVMISDVINMTLLKPEISCRELLHAGEVPVDKKWSERTLAAAKKMSIELKTGVYIGVQGPSYETPAEIRAFQKVGADMVGMSTVHEMLTARSIGFKTLGISCITNMAAGILTKRLEHSEVMQVASRAKDRFGKVVRIATEVLT